MRVVISSSLSLSLRVSAILDHFGYPSPHLDQWQQRVWYDLGTAQEFLHQMCSHLTRGLPAVTSPSRAESSSSSTEPTTMLICPSYGGKSIKASKEGGSAPRAATARLPLLQRLLLLKWRSRRRRNEKRSNALSPVKLCALLKRRES